MHGPVLPQALLAFRKHMHAFIMIACLPPKPSGGAPRLHYRCWSWEVDHTRRLRLSCCTYCGVAPCVLPPRGGGCFADTGAVRAQACHSAENRSAAAAWTGYGDAWRPVWGSAAAHTSSWVALATHFAAARASALHGPTRTRRGLTEGDAAEEGSTRSAGLRLPRPMHHTIVCEVSPRAKQ